MTSSLGYNPIARDGNGAMGKAPHTMQYHLLLSMSPPPPPPPQVVASYDGKERGEHGLTEEGYLSVGAIGSENTAPEPVP